MGKTDLPPQEYLVSVWLKGDTTCSDKFQFEVPEIGCFDCPDVIEVAAMVANTTSTTATVCVPVPMGVSTERDVQVNGVDYTGTMVACNETDVRGYHYGDIPNLNTAGRFSVAWKNGIKTFYTVVDNMDQLAAKMAQVDVEGGWKNIPADQTIITTKLFGDLGILEIRLEPEDAPHSLVLEDMEVALGTEFVLPEGINDVVVDGLDSGCADTVAVTVNNVPFPTHDPESPSKEVVGQTVTTVPGTSGTNNRTVLTNDTLKTRMGQPVTANLMINDYIDGEYSCFEIALQPANGYVTVEPDYAVTYRPFDEFCNTENGGELDKFFYEICMDNGSRYTAVAYIEVDCNDDIRLYPNPATTYVNLDLAPLAGQAVGIKIFNDLGVCIETIYIGEVTTAPFMIDLDAYRAGHYSFWIQPEKGKAKALRMVKIKL